MCVIFLIDFEYMYTMASKSIGTSHENEQKFIYKLNNTQQND